MVVHLLLFLALEKARIEAQLTGVLHELRARDVSALSPAQQVQRAASLAVLERYIERGEFPQRTDTQPGLRPRFIDHRGVHCAVGYLIAMSDPELARSINERFEYSYVRDITEPRLLAWADAHGFTVEELARIQPKYGHVRRPPTPDDLKRRLGDARESLALACAKHPHVSPVALHITGDASGHVRVTTASTEPFAACVAKLTTGKDRDDEPFIEKPKPFAFDLALALPTAQEILERRLAAMTIGEYCMPRPGAIPVQATVTYSEGIKVETEPRNEEIEGCIAERTKAILSPFAGIANLSAQRTAPVTSRLATQQFRWDTQMTARSVALACNPHFETLVVTVRARRDDPAFTIDVTTRDKKLATCIHDKLGPFLHDATKVSRQVNGKAEWFHFRIDADVYLPLPIKH